MKSKYLVLATFALASSAKAAKITDFAYTLTGKNQVVGENFANAIAAATQLSQDDQGCTFASRKTIYAFEDATIYVSVDGKTFNAFENASLMARGCYVPNQEGSAYSGIRPLAPSQRFDLAKAQSAPSLKDVELSLSAESIDAPEAMNQAIKDGIPVTQRQLSCSLPSTLPFVYLFADAAVFTSSDLTKYAAFPLDSLRVNGCLIPAMLVSQPDDVAGFARKESDFLAKYAFSGPASTSYLDQNYTNGICAGSWKWTDSIPSIQTTMSFDQINFIAKPTIQKWVDSGELVEDSATRYEHTMARYNYREANSGDTINMRTEVPDDVKAECDNFAKKVVPRQYMLTADTFVSIDLYNSLAQPVTTEQRPLKEWCAEKNPLMRAGNNQAVDLNELCNQEKWKQIAANENNEVPGSNLGYRPEAGQVPMRFEGSDVSLRAIITKDGQKKYIGHLGEGVPGEFTHDLKLLPRTQEDSGQFCSWSSKGYLCRNWAQWMENFSCKVTVKTRKLVPVIKAVVTEDYKRVAPKDETNIVGLTITRNMNPNSFANDNDKGITKDAANTKRPLYQPKPTGSVQAYLDKNPVEPASLISTREPMATWTCTSGDHKEANTVEQARDKYQYMMAQIEAYTRTVDITDYYLSGYCAVGKPCSLDSKPEFAGMVRNLRAFLIEKSNLFTDIQERISISTSIEAITTRFKNSYYEGQKPNGSIGD